MYVSCCVEQLAVWGSPAPYGKALLYGAALGCPIQQRMEQPRLRPKLPHTSNTLLYGAALVEYCKLPRTASNVWVGQGSNMFLHGEIGITKKAKQSIVLVNTSIGRLFF